jgi:FkbM family methyltransferase
MIFNSVQDVQRVGKSGSSFEEKEEGFLCKTLGSFWLYADKDDKGYMPHAKGDGYWEAWITFWMYKNVKPHHTVLDIGANHGYYSLMLATLGCTVVASEPQPKLARLISLSAKHNQYKRLTVLESAFSDKNGEAKFQVPIHHGMNATLSNKNSYDPYGSDYITVKTTRLDDELNSYDFIKIDAEGAEEKIWAGAQKYFISNPDTLVLIEWRYDRYEDPEAFAEDIFDKCQVSSVNYSGEEDVIEKASDLYVKKNEDWMLVLRFKNV